MFYNYFDVHDVCVENEKVPVTFLVPSFNIGRVIQTKNSNKDTRHLSITSASTAITTTNNRNNNNNKNNNSSNNSNEVVVGSKAQLPLWAAIALRKKGYVEVHVPSAFSSSSFRQFKMDPLVPNLYIMSPYYYELGLMLCRLIGNPPLSAITAASSSSVLPQSAAAPMNSNSSIHGNSRINTTRRRARNDSNDNNVEDDNNVNSNTYSHKLMPINVLSTEGRRLADQIFRLYQSRYLRVILSCAKCGFDRADVREKLCEMERELFDAVLKCKAEEHIWRNRLI